MPGWSRVSACVPVVREVAQVEGDLIGATRIVVVEVCVDIAIVGKPITDAAGGGATGHG
jgi:hypothetical protein